MRTPDAGGVFSTLLWQSRAGQGSLGTSVDGAQAFVQSQVFGRKIYRQLGNPLWDSSGGGTPGGTGTQLQYINASAFGGVAGSSWNGTTLILPLTSSPGSGSSSERFGASSVAAGTNATAFGKSAAANDTNTVAIGAGSSSTDTGSFALGSLAAASQGGTAIGTSASASAANAIAIQGSNSGTNSIIMGAGSSNSQTGSIGLGVLVAPTADHQFMVGSSVVPINSSVAIADSGGFTQSATAKSSTGTVRSMVDLASTWADSTDGTRKARFIVSVYDTAARECIRMEASGSVAMLSFFGVSAVAQSVLATGAGHTVDDVITLLQGLGLCRQS